MFQASCYKLNFNKMLRRGEDSSKSKEAEILTKVHLQRGCCLVTSCSSFQTLT